MKQKKSRVQKYTKQTRKRKGKGKTKGKGKAKDTQRFTKKHRRRQLQRRPIFHGGSNDYDTAHRIENVYNGYLDNVLFQEDLPEGIVESLRKLIFQKSFYDEKNMYKFANLVNNLSSVIPKNGNGDWVNCTHQCFTTCSYLTNAEMKSTAYILRLLSNSVLGDTKNNHIRFDVILPRDGNLFQLNLTGNWKDDQKFFKIQSMENKSSKNGRLIMGFGPSASGKTFSANKLVELMRIVDKDFPTFFLSIDGGICREQSIVYQAILEACNKNGVSGLTNLVSAGFNPLQRTSTIFDAGIAKKMVNTYLLDLKEKQKDIQLNLYVPETISSCVRKVEVGKLDCFSKYKDYITMTGDDNWIGVMIYQHKTQEDCVYKDEYKCEGTTKSGQEREKKEGKKYSADAWENSYKNGNEEILKAPRFRFRIHNSGSKDRQTIFEDLSDPRILSSCTIDFLKKNNWVYVNGKVKYSSYCDKYVKDNMQRELCKLENRKENASFQFQGL